MKTVTISDLKFLLKDAADNQTSFMVTRNGKPVGVWLSMHEFNALMAMADNSAVAEDHERVQEGKLDGFVEGSEDGTPPENGNLFFKRMSAVEQMQAMVKTVREEGGEQPSGDQQFVGFGLALVADAIRELGGSGWVRIVGSQGTQFREDEIQVVGGK